MKKNSAKLVGVIVTLTAIVIMLLINNNIKNKEEK